MYCFEGSPLRALGLLLIFAVILAFGSCAYTFTKVEDKPISQCDENQILDEAWVLFHREKYDEALHLAEYVREYFPDSPGVEESLYLAGESSFQLGEYWDAFQSFKELQTRFRASKYIDTVAERYYSIGEAYLDRSPGFFGHLFTGRSRGIKVMVYLVTRFSHHELADDAQLAMADYYFEEEDYLDSADLYSQLIKDFPTSIWVEKAVYRMGLSFIRINKGYSFNREELLQALVAMQKYVTLYPFGRYIKEAEQSLLWVQEEMARKELEIAWFYLRQDRDFGARIHLANVVLLFPETSAGREASDLLNQRGWDLSAHSVDRLVPRKPMGLSK